MPAPATADDLLDVLRKSGVTDEPKLAAFLKTLPNPPTDAAGMTAALVAGGLVTRFQADHLKAGKWKRFFIGKYKVLERLGVGGMAQVFLCEHRVMRRRVAVKVLPAARAAEPQALERFYREARAVAAVDHPNLVRAFDIDQDEGLHFLVMEYVDGTNLHDLVAKFGPLAPVRAAGYVRQAAVGLQHAHEMGLVHRDIKPGNLLVDRSGTVKILDLGLARFFRDTGDQLTKKYDESVLGTADFLAPEQAIDSSAADIRADLYALGGTLYFLLTGRPPFPEGNAAQKLMAHQLREPTPLEALAPHAPAELVAVVKKLMRKGAHERYQTPAELAAALAPWSDIAVPPPAENELPQLSPASTSVPALASSDALRRFAATDRPARPTPPAITATTVQPNPLLGAPLTPQAAAVVAKTEVWTGLTDPPLAPAPPDSLVTLTVPVPPRRWWVWVLGGVLIVALSAGMAALSVLLVPPR